MRAIIADDSATSRMYLEGTLQAWGYETRAVSDGEEAWAAHVAAPASIVVTDWTMPRCDGLELCRRIRGARHQAYVWIVMVTAKGEQESYSAAVDAGADDFLVKPVDWELFRVRLNVARRVMAMNEQLRALSSLLPICMHCKAVRSSGDHWRKIEEYLAIEGRMDLSHGFCPDCFYRHSLAPEIARLRESTPAGADRLAFLLEFDRRASPGLARDLSRALGEKGTQCFGDGQAGFDRAQCDALARWAADIGATRLVAALDGLLRGSSEATAARAELGGLVAFLGQRSGEQSR